MSASTERKMRQAAREAGTDKKMLARQEEEKKQAQSKRRWTLGTIGVLLLIAAILLLNSGILYKTTALTVDGKEYSASQVSYYYAEQYQNFVNQYGDYISYLGIDTSAGIKGLRDQPCSFEEGSWRDYFLKAAETQIKELKALGDYAQQNGIALDETELANVETAFDGLDDYVKAMGYSSADNFFAANYGEGVDQKMVSRAYQETALATKALTQLSDSFEYTPEQLREKYESYNGEYDLFDYAYYFVAAETVDIQQSDGTTSGEPTEETLAAARADAEAVMAAYKNSPASQDSVVDLDAALSQVIPEAYSSVQLDIPGSSLGDYKDWMTDAGRKTGDITVVDSSAGTGSYVVIFMDRAENDYNLAQVRHILIKAVAEEDGSYTDEAKAAARVRAEEILAEYEAGDKTEESFAALAEQYSEDAGSNTNGGLYDNVARGQMVQEFNDFCFDAHKKGDTAIVYGESGSYAGYHVMYYVGEGENYRDYTARTDLKNEDLQNWMEENADSHEAVRGFGIRFVG